jgi:hypothetical protein
MSKNVRIRTKVGVDKSVDLSLEQDFEFLEILSLKLSQQEVYTRQCADYGVVVGRVSVNDGFGVPNSKVSIFIPLENADETNPVISSIYPYKTVNDINEDGYRYNLLPYKPSYPGHSATGSFPDLEDVLTNPTAIEIYDKYYKFTVTTNDSGDFMIFGVPTGTYEILMNVDLSDIGPFSQAPQDLIRLGIATESQVNGTKFRASENLGTLPQIIFLTKTTTILPLWGDPELCQISITRTDFDLTAEANIEIKPTAIFMGSIFSDTDKGAIKKKCKPPLRAGAMCSLTSGPGQILALRQTIREDIYGRPLLEEYELENNGIVIDESGTWLVDVPMNLDYIVTNEFGEQVFSTDEKKGIPTRGKYRFKIKWVQNPDLSSPVRRANFLVPNISEYGWTNSGSDPLLEPYNSDRYQRFKASYAFSINWDDYGVTGDTQGEQMIQEAIDCKDRFYDMTYNKVYTISQLITRYTNGTLNRRFSAIKNITDDECEGSFNKFPTNDAQFKPDLLFIAFSILVIFFSIILKIIVKIFHVLCAIATFFINFRLKVGKLFDRKPFENNQALKSVLERFSSVNIPLYTFPDCELCSCKTEETNVSSGIVGGELFGQSQFVNSSVLADVIDSGAYEVNIGDESNDFSTACIPQMSGYRPTNTSFQIAYGSTFPILFRYLFFTNGDPVNTLLGFGSFNLPVPEMINLFNYKGKFFGTGLGIIDNLNNLSVETPLNLTNSIGNNFLNGGGVTQIKVTFNTDSNVPNSNPDFIYNSSQKLIPNPSSPLTNWNENTNKYHYDNIMVLLTEDIYQTGTLLSFTNPFSYQDPNLSGNTLNQYGTPSIEGENRYPTLQTTYISHTNPMTGERLRTRYSIKGEPIDENRFLRFPTNMEYFQVVTSMTYSNFAQLFGNDPGMNITNIWNRVMRVDEYNFVQSVFSKIDFNGGSFSPASFYASPFKSYVDRGGVVVTLLMRGVDPHSIKQKTKVGLGRFFSFQNHWDVSVTADLRMNIPLQPNDGLDFGVASTPTSQQLAIQNAQRCARHNNLTSLTNEDSSYDVAYSKNRLFFKSYRFKPSATQWTSYVNKSVNDYISTNEDDIGTNLLAGWTLLPVINPGALQGNSLTNHTFNGNISVGGGMRIGTSNRFCYSPTDNSFITSNNVYQFMMKYQIGELVEGGPIQCLGGTSQPPNWNGSGFPIISAFNLYYWNIPKYFSRKYTNADTQMSNNERIVMRSDRMPTSDQWQQIGPNALAGMQNSKFQVYEVPDEGVVSTGGTFPQQTFVINDVEPVEDVPNKISQILETFSCGSLVPVNCYANDFPDSITVAPTGVCTYQTFISNDGNAFNEKFFIEGSCYSLVRPPFNQRQNVNFDFELVNEWASRMNINFGACREVFSHLFVNNWVNGSLFMFPFRNSRYFTGPTETPPNQPYNKFCTDTVYLHPEDFNFYYRSSPYNGSSALFVGKDGFERNSKKYGNNKNLLYPTTIMDLGPRDELQKFLSQSGNWDGYIMNRLEPSTFGDTSDLLNIFFLSRLANTSFTNIFRTRGSSVLNFFSRKQKFVDADFAQMIATNSQLGIASYDPESYPEPPPNDTTSNSSLFLPAGLQNASEIVYGIFFTGDSQLRDYISPNRTIWNPFGQVTNECSFTYIPLNSQTVPFYLWDIKTNDGDNNIFGSQLNEWTLDAGYSYKYQGIDRFVPYNQSRIFQTDSNIINYRKGWIYNVEPNFINVATNELDYKPRPGKAGQYNFGAPFYFYFGLNRGATAFDRFTAKWIDTDAFTE